jgi:hypothetical protein
MRGNKCYISKGWMKRDGKFVKHVFVACERKATLDKIHNTLMNAPTPLIVGKPTKQPSKDWGIHVTPFRQDANFRYVFDAIRSAAVEASGREVEEMLGSASDKELYREE